MQNCIYISVWLYNLYNYYLALISYCSLYLVIIFTTIHKFEVSKISVFLMIFKEDQGCTVKNIILLVQNNRIRKKQNINHYKCLCCLKESVYRAVVME